MEKILSSAWIFLMLSTMLSVDASASEWMAFSCIKPFGGTSKCAIHSYPFSLRYACLLPVSLFWTSSSGIPQKQSTGGSEICRQQYQSYTWRSVTSDSNSGALCGKECNLEEQYQLGTEAALKPHLRTIIILKQGIVWCTSLHGNRVLLSRIPVFWTVIYCWLQQSTPLIDYLSCSIRTNLQIRAFWLR